jgi:hypothetical protein
LKEEERQSGKEKVRGERERTKIERGGDTKGERESERRKRDKIDCKRRRDKEGKIM